MRRGAALYVAGLGLFLVSFIWSWAALPPVVASHFDSNGNANGWMDHNSFLVFVAGMGLLALVVVPGFGGAGGTPPRAVHQRPEPPILAAAGEPGPLPVHVHSPHDGNRRRHCVADWGGQPGDDLRQHEAPSEHGAAGGIRRRRLRRSSRWVGVVHPALPAP